MVVIFKFIFLHEICGILFKMSLKYVSSEPTNSKSAFVKIMDCYQTDSKPLSQPMMAHLQVYAYAPLVTSMSKITEEEKMPK